jgi:hypothetical protein
MIEEKTEGTLDFNDVMSKIKPCRYVVKTPNTYEVIYKVSIGKSKKFLNMLENKKISSILVKKLNKNITNILKKRSDKVFDFDINNNDFPLVSEIIEDRTLYIDIIRERIILDTLNRIEELDTIICNWFYNNLKKVVERYNFRLENISVYESCKSQHVFIDYLYEG